MNTKNRGKQTVHWKAILGNLGLLMHVPCLMALFSTLIALIYDDLFSIMPLLLTGVIGLFLAQIFYRFFFRPEVIHLWDAMITAALGWLICAIIAIFPFIYISKAALSSGLSSSAFTVLQDPINALFESISGFTSTGLTMVQKPSELTPILQWWRSFLQWVGGIGLVVFIMSLVNVHKEGFSLYYAESRRHPIGKNIKETTHIIWIIYLFYTILSCFLLFISGMPFWDALNHAMTGVATGGFSTADQNLGAFGNRAQVTMIVVMILGTLSFPVHYGILRKGKLSELWKNSENRLLFLFLFFGAIAIVLLNLWTIDEHLGIDAVFQWVSALGTCGFSTTEVTIFAPMVRLFLIFAMFTGGPSDSTTGGLKICRFQNLVKSVLLRIQLLTRAKEKRALDTLTHKRILKTHQLTDVPVNFTEKTKRLYAATVLFIMWNFTIFFGWFLLLRWVPAGEAFNALFDATSALSNVGLSTGITTPTLPVGGKIVLMGLMWLGRLEIIPFLILVLSGITPLMRRWKQPGN